jgi:hypothetical protein
LMRACLFAHPIQVPQSLKAKFLEGRNKHGSTGFPGDLNLASKQLQLGPPP